MSESLRTIDLNTPLWRHYKTVNPFLIDKLYLVQGLEQACYEQEVDGALVSVGHFTFKGAPTHIAWGIKAELHCSFHKYVKNDGSWSEPIDGCPPIEPIRENDAIIGFALREQGESLEYRQ